MCVLRLPAPSLRDKGRADRADKLSEERGQEEGREEKAEKGKELTQWVSN